MTGQHGLRASNAEGTAQRHHAFANPHIASRKQVKAWVYGRTHHWQLARDDSDIHLVNLPPGSYIFRDGAPAGRIHATPHADGMKPELRCVDPQHKMHGQSVDLKWRIA